MLSEFFPAAHPAAGRRQDILNIGVPVHKICIVRQSNLQRSLSCTRLSIFLSGSASSLFQRSACVSVSEQKSPSASTPAMRKRPDDQISAQPAVGTQPPSASLIIADQDRAVLQPYAFDVSPYAFLECFPPVFDLSSRPGPPGSARRTRILPRSQAADNIPAGIRLAAYLPFQICRRHFRLPGQSVAKSSASILFPAPLLQTPRPVQQGEHVHFPSACTHSRHTALFGCCFASA